MKFTRGKRESVGLWINLIGGTGSGKSFSAMRLASGIAGDKPFAVIDTENRRALHYADQFVFDHAELRAPFTPDAYAEAIIEADRAGYPVIVVDSGTHVWAGDGGVLDMQEAEFERMGGRESAKMASWIKPKMAHKHMVSKMLQIKAHLILCLRAEQKIEMVKKDGKMVVQPKQSLTGLDGWLPVCDKNLPFEATCSFLLLADRPGLPHPIKLQEQHKAIFPLDTPITEQSGRRLSAWASGATKAAPKVPEPARTGADLPQLKTPSDAAPVITADEALVLEARCHDNGIDVAKLKVAAKVGLLSAIKPADLPRAHAWIDAVIEKRKLAREATT